MAQVGTVQELSGMAQAVGADGSTRVLVIGDIINEGEVVVTIGDDSSVKLEFENGKELTLGANEKALLDQSVVSSEGFDNADVTAAQQAILAGEALPEEATALGEDGPDGAGGFTPAFVADRSDARGDVNTHNLGTDGFTATPIDGVQNQTLFAPTISINLVDSSVYESGLDNGTGTLPGGINAVGTFTLTDLNGLSDIQTLTIGGTVFNIAGDPANFTAMVGQTVATEYGEVTITSFTEGVNGQSGTFGYEYVLGEATIDIEGEIETDGFTIIVNDGTFEASADVVIEIVDDVPVIEDVATVVHDEFAGAYMFEVSESRMYGPPMENNNVDYSDDIFTQLVPMYGEVPIDMIGVALSELSPMQYNAGADGLYNVALTDNNGNLFNGLNSGLKVTANMNDAETSKPIYLYSVTAEFLAKLGLQIDPSSEESINLVGDNIVLGLTVDNFDDFVSQLQTQGDEGYSEGGVYDAVSEIAFVVGLYEGETDSSTDDYLAVLQLQAINHGDITDPNDEEILDAIYLSVTDGDGDIVTSAEPLNVVFVDDGPTIPSFNMNYPQSLSDFRPSPFFNGVTADEDNIPDGNNNYDPGDDYQAFYTLNGTLNFDYGADGPGGIDFLKMDGLDAGFTSNGNSVSFTWDATDSILYAIADDGSENGIVVFSLDIDPIYGTYNFMLQDSVDHPEGDSFNDNTEDPNINLALTYTVTDGDGDSIDGEFNVSIDDDIPVIGEPESTTVDEEFLATALTQDDGYDGDIVGGEYNTTSTGSLDISWGADNNNIGETNNRSVSFSADQLTLGSLTSHGIAVAYMINEGEDILTAYTGTVGENDYNEVFVVTLSDIENGSYEFELKDTLDHPIGKVRSSFGTEDDINLSFNFIATDSDGDSVSSSFMVTVDDDAPVIPQVENGNEKLVDNLGVHVDDDVQDNGNPDGIGDDVDALHTTGTLSYEYGADGEGTVLLAQGGAPDGFEYTMSQNGTLLMISQNGVDVLQVKLTDMTSGNYTVTQIASIDHPEGNDENNVKFKIHYNVTDGDGDIAKGLMVVHVDDDTPVVTIEQPEPLEFTVTNHDEESSAGYHSSYGYYIKGDDGEPTSGFIIWDDVHDSDADTFSFSGYDHDEIGYFIIPNGENLNSSLDDGTPVTFMMVDGQWQAFAGETALVGAGSHVLFDNASLNKDGQAHFIDNSLDGNQNWEDLQIPTGDGDFNDVNINVISNDGIVPLMTDETDIDLSTETFPSDTINLSSFFDISFGADGPNASDPVVYNLSLSNEGVDSGLLDTQSDSAVFLKMDGDIIQGYIDGGTLVFSLSVDNSGNVTLTQYRSVTHDDSSDPDEVTSPEVVSDGLILLSNVVTDGDGDSITSDAIDISSLVTFRDDGPVIASQEIQIFQESFENFRTTDGWSVAAEDGGNIIGDHGVVWTVNEAGIEIQRGNVGGSTASDGDSHAELDSHDLLGNGGTTLSVLSTQVNLPTGEISLSFDYKARPDDLSGSDMKITLAGKEVVLDSQSDGTVTITTNDGVSFTQTTNQSGWIAVTLTYQNISGENTLSFEGLADTNGGNNTLGAYLDNINMLANTLQVDESTLFIDDVADFSGHFTTDFGADGAGEIVYGLSLNADSNDTGIIDTLTDENVELFINNGVIEGRTSSELVFTISVDNDGKVTLNQIRAVVHTDNNDHDSVISLNTGLINLDAVITDGDGDEASSSIDLSAAISFRDDGPVAVADENTVKEDDEVSVITGDVTSNDTFGADGGAFDSWDSNEIAQFGTFTDLGNGEYSYELDNTNPTVDALNVDSEPLTETFTYTIVDNDGDTSTKTLTISINGTNDAPIANVDSIIKLSDTFFEHQGTGDAWDLPNIDVYSNYGTPELTGNDTLGVATTTTSSYWFFGWHTYAIDDNNNNLDGYGPDETIGFNFDKPLTSVTMSLSDFDAIGLHDKANWEVFDSAGTSVASGVYTLSGFEYASDVTFDIDPGVEFSRVEISAKEGYADFRIKAIDGYGIEENTFVIDKAFLLDNDTDVDGGELSIGTLGGIDASYLSINGDGNVVFTPGNNFGESSIDFTYTAFDGYVESAPANVTVDFVQGTISAGDESHIYNLTAGDLIIGSDGHDTLIISDDDSFDLSKIQNIEVIELDNNPTIGDTTTGLTAQEVFSITGGDDLTITGDGTVNLHTDTNDTNAIWSLVETETTVDVAVYSADLEGDIIKLHVDVDIDNII